MTFSLRQLQEKCIEQNPALNICFVDLSKAFDTVPRDLLWIVLSKFGCPPTFLYLIKALNTVTKASVSVNGDSTSEFLVTIGTRQGCILARTLINLLLVAVLQVAYCDYIGGVHFRFRTYGGLQKLSRFSAKTKYLEYFQLECWPQSTLC